MNLRCSVQITTLPNLRGNVLYTGRIFVLLVGRERW